MFLCTLLSVHRDLQLSCHRWERAVTALFLSVYYCTRLVHWEIVHECTTFKPLVYKPRTLNSSGPMYPVQTLTVHAKKLLNSVRLYYLQIVSVYSRYTIKWRSSVSPQDLLYTRFRHCWIVHLCNIFRVLAYPLCTQFSIRKMRNSVQLYSLRTVSVQILFTKEQGVRVPRSDH